VLWTVLPFVAFVAAYVPEVASFAAGQAAFTMMVLIVFNLIVPSGWRVGLIRIEDIVVGGAVGVVVSLFLWPRGSGNALSAAIDAAFDVGTRYLRAAVSRITHGASFGVDAAVTDLSHTALTASRTVDAAVRQYLSEGGGATDPRAPVLRRANRAGRLRGAADLIADIAQPPPTLSYLRARAVLDAHADLVCERMSGRIDTLEGTPISTDFVIAVRADAHREEHPIAHALPLVALAAQLGELELLYATKPVTEPVTGRADR
jgi:uncharacterized membrane protein YccC